MRPALITGRAGFHGYTSATSPRHLAPEAKVSMLYAHIHAKTESELAEAARLHARRRSGATAALLACLAVVDTRRSFLKLGYSSMWDYATRDLLLSEDSAKKFLGAARVGHRFPMIFDMIADRRLTVSTVLTLRAYLDEGNAEELLRAAAGRTREDVAWLIAQRFPESDRLPLESPVAAETGTGMNLRAPGPVAPPAEPNRSDPRVPVTPSHHLRPLSDQRVEMSVTIDRSTREKLRRAQDLLGQTSLDGFGILLDRALDLLIHSLEKKKHGLHTRRSEKTPGSTGSRHIPAGIRATVHARDGGQCAFVSESGVRCTERTALQYDHVVPLAMGGKTSVANLRLLCAPHNQAEADRVLGFEFMAIRRSRREQGQARKRSAHADLPPNTEHDLRAALHELGYRGSEIKLGLSAAASAPMDSDLALRVRLALRALGRGTCQKSPVHGLHATG